LTADRIEQWNQRYLAGEHISDAPAAVVVEFTRDLEPGDALDLACGPGRNAVYLAGRGWHVTAVDASPVAIDLLRQRAPDVEARLADLESGEYSPPSATFDLVLSCLYLQRSLIEPMKSALRPGGMLILIALLADPNQPEGSSTRARIGELPTYFEGWEILHHREGAGHGVAELVVRKPTAS
jgi:SAM-dependent methyltransferase